MYIVNWYNVNIIGLQGTYKGLLPTILKQGTNQAIRFFVYSEIKKFLQGGDNSKDIGVIQTFCAGGTAGAASVFGNTPIDVVKTRMQVWSNTRSDREVVLIMFKSGLTLNPVSSDKSLQTELKTLSHIPRKFHVECN